MRRALGFAAGYCGLAILLVVVAPHVRAGPGWDVALDAVAGVFAVAASAILAGTWWRDRPVARDEVGPPDEGRAYGDMIIMGLPDEAPRQGPSAPRARET